MANTIPRYRRSPFIALCLLLATAALAVGLYFLLLSPDYSSWQAAELVLSAV
jgi:hypothetical protein